jgi:regulator of protease activity HflC (stomatin/prohibitin superfamily)
MFLIILGMLALVSGFVVNRSSEQLYRLAVPMRIIGLVLIVIGVLTASVKQVDAGQVGVQKLFGKVQKNVLESGLNTVNPLVEVITFDIKTQNYTMSAVQDEGDKSGDDAIRVLTGRRAGSGD